MEKKEIAKKSLISALYVLAYIVLVATLMTNGDRFFGGGEPENIVLTGVAILLLFVLSAAVVGSAIFLKPAMMFVEGAKKEALLFLTFTIAWLLVITIAAFLVLAWV